MSDFSIWFQTGIEHISDLQGYDHLLFLFITTGVFLWRDIKKVLYLITGFTIGHSITLALCVFKLIHFNSTMIEIFIPVTILLTAMFQVISQMKPQRLNVQMIFIVFFGFIHGMGFSTLLSSMLGKEGNIALPLLYFNLGIEIGQIFIVVMILTISTIFIHLFKVQKKHFVIAISVITIVMSTKMIVDRIPQKKEEKKEMGRIPFKTSYFCSHSKFEFSFYA